jgi:hypothetical protein
LPQLNGQSEKEHLQTNLEEIFKAIPRKIMQILNRNQEVHEKYGLLLERAKKFKTKKSTYQPSGMVCAFNHRIVFPAAS